MGLVLRITKSQQDGTEKRYPLKPIATTFREVKLGQMSFSVIETETTSPKELKEVR